MIQVSLRKHARRFLARENLQSFFRLLYRFSLLGMNYGGAASERSSGDDLGLKLLAQRRSGQTALTIFDVGANVGGYVASALRIVGEGNSIFAFEPSMVAFSHLSRNFDSRSDVHLVRAGVGAEARTSNLYAAIPGSVLASTYASPLTEAQPSEQISVITLDSFCDTNNIRRIDLLKLDVEGGEVDALRGAKSLLGREAIRMIQFEFGQSSLGSRTYFVDLFKMLDERFEIYRVLPDGLTKLVAYHETLEVFMSTNYLAVARS